MFVSLNEAPPKIPKYIGSIGFALASYVRVRNGSEEVPRPRLIISFPRRTHNLKNLKDELLDIMDDVLARNLRVRLSIGVPGTPDEGLVRIQFDENRGIKITQKHESEASVTFCIPSHMAQPFKGKSVNRVWTNKWAREGNNTIVVVAPKEVRHVLDYVANKLVRLTVAGVEDEAGGAHEAA